MIGRVGAPTVGAGVHADLGPHNPAFPQIILNGELVGGLDIFKEALESGEWDEMYSAEPGRA